jgi:hypothetical protein
MILPLKLYSYAIMNNVFVQSLCTQCQKNWTCRSRQVFIMLLFGVALYGSPFLRAQDIVPGVASSTTSSVNAQPAARLPLPEREHQSLEQLLEFLAQQSSINPSLDALEYLGEHPVPLSNVSAKTLQTIPGISSETALAIVSFVRRYRQQTRRVPSVEMLRDSLYLSDAQAFILAFCTVAGEKTKQSSGLQPSLLSLWYRARARFWAIPQRGTTSEATAAQRFQGSALDLYQRLSLRFDANAGTLYEVNCTAAKDAGERSVIDFLSGYARAEFGRDSPTQTSIIAGDYLVQSGMGTGLWQIFGPKKSADVIAPVTQTATALTPYRSSTEQQFFRGLAASSRFVFDSASGGVSSLRSLQVMAWASSQARAATIDTVQNTATSLDLDGLFRTRTEISKRNRLLEQVVGASIEAQFQHNNQQPALTLGASAFWLQYDKPITSRSVQVFPQQRGLITTLHGTLTQESFGMTAEIMRDGAGNIGGRIGAETRIEAAWELAAMARAFGTEFRSPFGINFGENPKPSNEVGLYVGAVWKAVKGVRVNSYLDFYTTLSSTSTVPAPVRGVDIFTEGIWQTLPDLQLTARLRHETKTDAMTITTTLGRSRTQRRVVFGRSKSSVRLHGAYSVSNTLTLQARAEAVLIGFQEVAPAETGVLAFVGCTYSPVPQLDVTARFVGFSTDSFDSALWQYESTIAGTLSNPPLYGKGIRAYCLVSLQPLDNALREKLHLALRASLTRRFDVSTLSSGATQINGNMDAQVVMQVEVQF